MDDSNIPKPHTKSPPAETERARPNAQDYLHLLIEREQQIDGLTTALHRLELEKQELQGRIAEKEQTINDLRAEIDELRASVEASASRATTHYGEPAAQNIIPLMTFEESFDDEPAAPVHASPVRRSKKPVRIDSDLVARLKNDRKAYPVVCDKALMYWQMLADEGLIDHRLKPTSRCGVTVMARIVSRMQTTVDPNISWAFFERHWGCDHLQSNLHRETYKHRNLYPIVNRIFGLPDDAPYLTKSSQAV